jgi:hypothetical protein
MDLWFQPCAACADLYGQLAAINPHDELTLSGAGNVKDARIPTGPPARQTWMLLNAGQH